MAFITREEARIYYRLEGGGGRPLLVLVHSLGVDNTMWDPQVPALLPYFQVLRLDLRGHGASSVPPGEYTLEQLARDVLAAADAAGGGPFAYCGLSLGGMIGQWLGAHAPERVTRLVLANTSPKMADPSLFDVRRRTVLDQGMAAIADAVMGRFFSPRTLARGLASAASTRHTLLTTDPAGYAGCCSAIRDMDNTPHLARFAAPVLVIAGDSDQSTPWRGHGDVLAASIPGARAVRLPSAHLSNLELPSSFNSAVLEFLLEDSRTGARTGGEARRREVLGDAHVDRSAASATDLNREFQDLITRYAWGEVWSRPGLDTRTRRLLVLAITASLGRWEEFRLHVRAAFAGGLEPCDVKETLLQTAVYAGLPAANTAFHIAGEEARALEEEG